MVARCASGWRTAYGAGRGPAALRDPGRDPAGDPRRRRHRHRRPAGARAAGPAARGLHYGTYDYSAALGVAAAYQAMDHPVADHAKAVMQVAAAGTGVPVSRRLDQRAAGRRRRSRSAPPGRCTPGWSAGRWSAASTRAGTCTRPSCRPGTWRPSRSSGRARRGGRGRLRDYLAGVGGGVLDEPATARALAGFLLRGRALRRGRRRRGGRADRGTGRDARRARAAPGRLTPWRPRPRGQRHGVLPDGELRPAVVAVPRRPDRRRRAAAAPGRRRASRSRSPTTRCCCPAWSTPTCTSTSRAAPSGRASRPRPRAAAAGGVTTIVDMPLNSHPADRRRRRAGGQARGRDGPVPRRRRLLGRRGARQRSATCGALHDAGVVRLQVLPASTPACRSSRRWTRAELRRGAGRARRASTGC